jgi:hypothetical protein
MTSTPAEGSAVPPYEGRRETADVDGEDKSRRDGVNVGGATGPVESSERKASEPAATLGAATSSPADEQPAEGTRDGEPGAASVGPAHLPGTRRGEDMSEDEDKDDTRKGSAGERNVGG